MDTFSAISEPTRREILELLARDGQLTATDICRRFPVSASAISQHLKILREAGLVTVEKHAQQRLYAIDPRALDEIGDWTANMRRMWSERFDRLEEILKAEKDRLVNGKEPDGNDKTKPG